MAFQGYPIFPGLRVIGAVSPSVQELAVTFNTASLAALQEPVAEDMMWADVAGVTPAVFQGKVVVDLTNLDGYEPWEGTTYYKDVEAIAVVADVSQWARGIRYDARLDEADNVTLKSIYASMTQAQSLVYQARVMKPRLCASVLMQGTPFPTKPAGATVYQGNAIPGAGLPLFSTNAQITPYVSGPAVAGPGSHLANPTDPNSRTFNNYFQGFGAFSPLALARTRAIMRIVPAPNLSAETLGLQVTDVIGASHMEEPFRQVALSTLALQVGTGPAAGAVAAPTNVYAAGTTPWRYWIAPQLDGDPYLQAWKAANPSIASDPSQFPHFWIAVSRTRPGVRCIETVAPTKDFTPRITIFGDGTELAAQTRKIHIQSHLDGGAAAGFPHCVARFEQGP
jgi:hypothetical protein